MRDAESAGDGTERERVEKRERSMLEKINRADEMVRSMKRKIRWGKRRTGHQSR